MKIMKNKLFKIRVFLLAVALGLSSVPFFKSLYNELINDAINLPQISSNNPLIISPETKNFTSCCGGGSGPDGQSEPPEIINTLGSNAMPHIIKNAHLQEIILPNAELTAAIIENSDFSYASLVNANFSKASILYSGFTSANLRNADFTGGRFFGSDLTDADFSNAKLTRANFAHSDFTDANLKNADLTDTNLSDANLESVEILTYEQLSKAIINEYTVLPAKFRSKSSIFLINSRKRMKELKNQLSAEELELFSNQFDFLD